MVKFIDWIDTKFCILKVKFRNNKRQVLTTSFVVIAILAYIIIASKVYLDGHKSSIVSFIRETLSEDYVSDRVSKLEGRIELLSKSEEEKDIRIKELEQQIKGLATIADQKDKQIKRLALVKKPLLKREELLNDSTLVREAKEILGLDIKIR